MEFGGLYGRVPGARLRLEASGLSSTSAAVSVFCFGVLLSSKAFVTDATLRSTARKNCLKRDLDDMSAVNNLLFFSKLHSQGFGDWSAI